MSGGFPLDIVLWALVAGFILLRLRAILGRTDEADLARRAQRRSMGGRPAPASAGEAPPLADEERAALAHRGLEQALAAIRRHEPDFTLAHFLEGARAFYPMILEAYWRGDRETLRAFLVDEVHEDFARAIAAREEAGETVEGRVESLERVTVEDIRLDGREAEIDLRYVARIALATKDAEGRVIAGDPERAERVEDIWTLTRRLGDPDPNWRLAATRRADDDA